MELSDICENGEDESESHFEVDKPAKESDKKGSYLYQYLAATICTLTTTASGMITGWPSPSVPKLLDQNSTLPITDDEGAWLAVLPLFGACVGSISAASTVDIFGRKKLILFTAVPALTSWIMVAFAETTTVLFVGRAIGGACNGVAFTVVVMYLGEIADPKIRGALGTSCSMTYIFGVFLMNALGFAFTIKVAALISTALPLVLLLSFVWMPESPYYLVMKEEFHAAKKSLRTFRGRTDVEEEFNRINWAVTEQMKNTGKFVDLFTVASNRKAVAIAFSLRTVQQFSGTMAITFYAETLFSQSTVIPSNVSTLLYFGTQLVVTFFTSTIVDKIGRRPLLVTSIVGSALALSIEGTFFYLKLRTNVDTDQFSFVQIIGLICFVVLFSLGMQTIPVLILCELFPTNVKAFALCFGDICFCITASATAKFFQLAKGENEDRLYVPFFTFAGCCVVGLVFITFCVPETKGKTLEEIQMNLKGKKGPLKVDKSIMLLQTKLS